MGANGERFAIASFAIPFGTDSYSDFLGRVRVVDSAGGHRLENQTIDRLLKGSRSRLTESYRDSLVDGNSGGLFAFFSSAACHHIVEE